ncbi:MAG: hypothetical protein ACQEXJ_15105 [Myxococcota bacterium]
MYRLICIVSGSALALAACGGGGDGEGIGFGDIPGGGDVSADAGDGVTGDGGVVDALDDAADDVDAGEDTDDAGEDTDDAGEDTDDAGEPDTADDADAGEPDTADDADAGEPDTADDADAGEPDTAGDADAGQPDTVPTCPTPPDDPCEEEGERRCATEGEVVEECVVDDQGCMRWQSAESCLTTNLCTGESDECVQGECVPSTAPVVECDPIDEQCLANLCDPETGECEVMPADDFEPCDDDNLCTESDQCFQGTCQGTQVCPMDCGGPDNELLGNLSCGDAVDITLNDGGTNTMDGYGCDGAMDGSTGWERTFRIQNTNSFDCPDMELTVELPDPSQDAADFVDVVVLDKAQGICWPDDCLGVGFMDDAGEGDLAMNLPAGADWLVVVDGRNGYAGDVRLAVNCCGTNVEALCGNDFDDDGDGTPVDCNDKDCSDSFVCDFEHVCDNGVDDDGDGLPDCLDPDCVDLPSCDFEVDCANGIDDDQDGLTDCDDVEDCGDEVECGGGCPEAIMLECGDMLTGETLAQGVSTFADQAIPCGDDSDIALEGPHGLYGATVPADCTAEFVVDTSEGLFADAMLAGPACGLDACVDSTAVFAQSTSFPLSGLSPAWLVVSAQSQKDVPYDVGLQCDCQ